MQMQASGWNVKFLIVHESSISIQIVQEIKIWIVQESSI